jgi:hypothetical protein
LFSTRTFCPHANWPASGSVLSVWAAAGTPQAQPPQTAIATNSLAARERIIETAYALVGPVSPWKSKWRHARATALAGLRRIAPGHWTSDGDPFGEGMRGNSVAKSQEKQFAQSVIFITEHPSPADYSQAVLSEGQDGR